MTTDEKIVKMVEIALKERNHYALFRLSNILEQRGYFEEKLSELLKNLDPELKDN